MTRRFLVTGATGDTGRRTAALLLKQGFCVRAFVHRADARSQALAARGADIVVGDLLDYPAVRAAMAGIDGAYFCYPIAPGVIDATTYFAQAARTAGVEAIVNMSQKSSREDSESHAARDHWIAERVLDWSGVPTTHLRPTFFAQWLTYPHNLKAIVEQGVLIRAFADGRHAPIAAEDQARFIAAGLADPVPHRGRTYPLCGPVEMHGAEIAAAVGEVIGRDVAYKPVSIEAARERMRGLGMPPFLVQHLGAVAQDCRDGIFAGTDEIIADVTGTPPMSVQQFVAANIELFRAAAATQH